MPLQEKRPRTNRIIESGGERTEAKRLPTNPRQETAKRNKKKVEEKE